VVSANENALSAAIPHQMFNSQPLTQGKNWTLLILAICIVWGQIDHHHLYSS